MLERDKSPDRSERVIISILAMRFDATEIGGGWQEIYAYGTAVKIRPLS